MTCTVLSPSKSKFLNNIWDYKIEDIALINHALVPRVSSRTSMVETVLKIRPGCTCPVNTVASRLVGLLHQIGEFAFRLCGKLDLR